MKNKNTKQESTFSEFCAIQSSCVQCKSRGGCENYTDFKKKSYNGSVVAVTKKDKKGNIEVVDVELNPKKWINPQF